MRPSTLSRGPLLTAATLLLGLCPAPAAAQDLQVSWDVLPPMIVRDNYGGHLSSKYFAFSVSILNGSKDTLIVKSFDLKGRDLRLLSPDFNTVRASIVKGQMTGRRNTGIRALKGTGSTAAALNGFFKAAQSAATYGRFVSVFSGPFITALEAVVPDTTVAYLEAWDKNKVFKDGLVVDPGQSANGTIFVPIQSLYPDYVKPSRKLSQKYNPADVKKAITEILPQGYSVQGTPESLSKKQFQMR